MKAILLTSILSFVLLGASMAATVFNGNTNSGFGGVLGTGNFSISDNGSQVTITFNKGVGTFSDTMVIYIDSVTGGVTNTGGLSDNGDLLRQAISGFDGTNRSQINFFPGFGADYSIAASPDPSPGPQFGGLWGLVEGGANSLSFVAGVNLTPSDNTAASSYTMTFNVADIGLTPGAGQSFNFVATYLNETNAFRSDEALGAAIAGGNPGAGPVSFGSFATYTTAPEPSRSLLAMIAACTVVLRRRRF